MTRTSTAMALSIPVVLCMLGGIWAQAPARLLCPFNRGTMHDAKVSLTNRTGSDETEWILSEMRARGIVVLVLGTFMLGACLIYVTRGPSSTTASSSNDEDSSKAGILWPLTGTVASFVAASFLGHMAIFASETIAMESSIFVGMPVACIWLLWTAVRLGTLMALAAIPLGYICSGLTIGVGYLLATAIQQIPIGEQERREALSYVLATTPFLLLTVYGIGQIRLMKRKVKSNTLR